MQIVLTKVAQFDNLYEWPLHFKPKTKQLKGYTSIGWTRRDSSLRGGQNTPRGGAEGINNSINTISTQVKLYNGHPSTLCHCKYNMKEYKCTYIYIFICV